MGNPIEPTDEEWQGCPDCCASLPEVMGSSIDLEPWGHFTGSVTRMPQMLCSFWGPLWHGEQYGTMIVTFCSDDTGKAAFGFWPPIGDPVYGNTPGIHCYPNFESDGDSGSHVEVWKL